MTARLKLCGEKRASGVKWPGPAPGQECLYYALFENLAGGATIDEFVEGFSDVDRQQVPAVLEQEAKELRNALTG